MAELNRILRNGRRLFLRVRLVLRSLKPIPETIRMCAEIVYGLARRPDLGALCLICIRTRSARDGSDSRSDP
jgi:hypothetical protein